MTIHKALKLDCGCGESHWGRLCSKCARSNGLLLQHIYYIINALTSPGTFMWQLCFLLLNTTQKYTSTSFCRKCFTSLTLYVLVFLRAGAYLFDFVWVEIWTWTQYFSESVYRWIFIYTLLFLILRWGRVLICPKDWLFFGWHYIMVDSFTCAWGPT